MKFPHYYWVLPTVLSMGSPKCWICDRKSDREIVQSIFPTPTPISPSPHLPTLPAPPPHTPHTSHTLLPTPDSRLPTPDSLIY
ncbi:MAG: hypothetical protein F6K26_30010 [Moorea sp. SIO2I5]|nr:hypothetical protein [Moorena sp. SIO2I5]